MSVKQTNFEITSIGVRQLNWRQQRPFLKGSLTGWRKEGQQSVISQLELGRHQPT